MDKYRESRGSFASAASTPKKASSYGTGSDFLRLSKVIGNNIQKIESNVRQMKTLLSDLERTPEDTKKLSLLHEVQQKTNAMVKDTGAYIQDLNNIPKGAQGTQQRQQHIQRERLVSQFTKTVDDFQVVQKKEKEKTKEQVVRDRISIKRFKESRRLGPVSEETAVVSGGGQGQMMMVQVDVTDIEMELMREREEELRKLEADIMDVNEIFRDLGVMIREQGEVIDTIENNVESAAVDVENGKEQLHKAHEHSMSARKKKCIIIIVVSVVIAVIIIIIVLSTVLSKR